MANPKEEAEKLFNEAMRNYLKPVYHLIEDNKVTEILINSYKEIFVEIGGKMQATDAQFADEIEVRSAANIIAQFANRRIDDENPRLDARLPNGSRVHIVIPPCAFKGTTIAIRKFFKSDMTFKKYVQLGAISVEGAQFLDTCMKLGKNILVSGGTGSGKTTLLGLLASRIPPGQRLIVIEDAKELKIDYEHVVFFETRMPDKEGKGEVSIRDLVISSLRLRPDRIIVGEVRGSEALELVQAMNTGHKGCMGTVHANTPSEAMVRLEALAQGGDAKISEKALTMQISSAVDIVVQVTRFSDGSRRISEIAEVLGLNEKNGYETQPIFKIGRMLKQPDGKLKGEMQAENLPTFLEEIKDNAIPFPMHLFKKNKAA